MAYIGEVALVAHLCPTLSDPMDCSPPGSSVHGIFQARILECVAIFSSPGDLPDPSNKPRSPALQADSLPSEPSLLSFDRIIIMVVLMWWFSNIIPSVLLRCYSIVDTNFPSHCLNHLFIYISLTHGFPLCLIGYHLWLLLPKAFFSCSLSLTPHN